MARAGRGGMRPEQAAMGATGMPMGGPSEAELQAMLLQMREAPIEQVLAEVINVLFQTIQVKLGLGDARTLIDVAAALTDVTAGRIDGELHARIVAALAQLRLAQVEEEGRQGAPVAGPDVASEAVGASGAGDGAPSGAAATPAAGVPSAQNAASRLWVPGR